MSEPTLIEEPELSGGRRPNVKRKSSENAESVTRKGREGPKKKKASRACAHCQKAHLTCDDFRPCSRCIKRGMASECTEGHRKKAKYLLDDDELEQLKKNKPDKKDNFPVEITAVATEEIFDPSDPALNMPFDPNFSFTSEAANLEYSILSAILGNPSPPESSSSPSQSLTTWPATESITFSNAYDSIPFAGPRFSIPSETPAPSSSGDVGYIDYGYPDPQRAAGTANELQYQQSFQPSGASEQGPLHPLQPRFPLDMRPRSPPAPASAFLDSSQGYMSTAPNDSTSMASINLMDSLLTISNSSLQGINNRVVKPYDYTEGYHFLMKHLPSRFEKNDILRIVRALAIFRPSLIALQMPLSLEDEIFVEKCFQRTLLELEKLMSFSGTPTVVWRRTGEICLASPEFCLLADRSVEELVGKKKYIYELLENQSVVEYWENFASHAFENTTQSVYSHCVLLKASGAPVPCTFCFSIRRDLFDLPSVVIGQWLPLL